VTGKSIPAPRRASERATFLPSSSLSSLSSSVPKISDSNAGKLFRTTKLKTAASSASTVSSASSAVSVMTLKDDEDEADEADEGDEDEEVKL